MVALNLAGDSLRLSLVLGSLITSFLVNFRFSNFQFLANFQFSNAFQNVILGLVRNTEGNAHVTREQLFTNVDGYYSMCYAASRGNVRSFFRYCPAGRRLNTQVAQFRLKKRTEVIVNWHRMTADGVIAVLGKLSYSERFRIELSF